MSSDSPIVDEVRHRALEISVRFEDDMHKYCAFLKEEQKAHCEKVVDQITVVRAARRMLGGELASHDASKASFLSRSCWNVESKVSCRPTDSGLEDSRSTDRAGMRGSWREGSPGAAQGPYSTRSTS